MSPKYVVRRGVSLIVAIALVFTLVGLRFWYLEVVRGTYYQTLARQDYLRKLPIPAPRGNMVTSDGVTVATSKPAWSLYYLNQGGPMPPTEVDALARYLGVSPASIEATVKKGLATLPPYQPIAIADQLTPQQMTAIEENLPSLPNTRIQPIPVRTYPFGSLMGNILGYVSDISAQQYQQLKNKGYSMTSIVGASGLEASYQNYLRGHSGGEYAEVNRQGQLVRLFGQEVPTPGDTLHLTINWHLEQTAQDALAYTMYAMQHANPAMQSYAPEAVVGGVIALNPTNGDVLAIASLPSYNPNKLVPGSATRSAYYTKLLTNPLNPLLVRPIAGLYSPGSVFKPVMAVAALASGVINPSTIIYDPGYFPRYPAFHNWFAPGFGALNIEQAIGLSDDTFFYTLGYDMGIQTMDHWMSQFLLDRPTGIDLPGEVTSRMPTPQLLQAEQGVPWTWGWNLNTAIGQGIDQFTMIALARAESAIANGGTLYRPHLVSSITSATGHLVKTISPEVQGHLNVSPTILHTVQVGMEMSAQDPNIAKGVSGTGYGALAGFPIPLASKTGTAQVSGHSNNAFFITYGPMPNPQILIVVYIRSGHWGADSGFVARAIYDQYFKVKDPAARPLFDSVYGRPFAWPFGYTAPSTKLP